MMKNVFAIIGSAQPDSSNFKLVQFLENQFSLNLHFEIFDGLKTLPHFDAVQTLDNTPDAIQEIRRKIENADAVLLSSPEYIFSIPAGLKNLLEWCVATTIFTNKQVDIIVASADGRKAFEEIKLIMKTLGAVFTDDTALLINGVKGKFSSKNEVDADTQQQLIKVVQHLQALL